MSRLFSLFICVLFSSVAMAQNGRFNVVYKNGNLVIEHAVKKGETVFSLSRMYHAPPSMITDINRLDYKTELSAGSVVDIPLGVYNHINEQPEYMNDMRPLYYTAQGREEMGRIVRITGVPQRKIEKWNNLPDNLVRPGQELMVGWILFDATPVKSSVKEPEEITRTRGDWSTRAVSERNEIELPERSLDLHPGDTSFVIKKVDTTPVLNPEEELYKSQTLNEQRVITEKGPAVFFTGAAGSQKAFYAFHNTAARGAIIKVFNPGTGKTVYVKVIGRIPGTAQYYNSIIGISAAAKRELKVREDKMFCEISYGVL
jgi:hypothetical protein